MTDGEISRAALSAILASGVEYVMVGGYAVIAHTFPRTTLDVDFVVAAPLGAIARIAPYFPPQFRLDPQPQMELLTGTYRWNIEVDGSAFRIEIFHLSDDPHHQELFRRRVAIAIPDLEQVVWIPAADDLVSKSCAGLVAKIWTMRKIFWRCKTTRSIFPTLRDGARNMERWTGWQKLRQAFRRGCRSFAGVKVATLSFFRHARRRGGCERSFSRRKLLQDDSIKHASAGRRVVRVS